MLVIVIYKKKKLWKKFLKQNGLVSIIRKYNFTIVLSLQGFVSGITGIVTKPIRGKCCSCFVYYIAHKLLPLSFAPTAYAGCFL